MAELIKIDGLAQFNRALRRLDSEAPKGLRVALNQAAALVADDARAKVPRRSGRAAASIRVASTRTEVRVRVGGARAPYYPWLDFGGRVGRRKSVKRAFLKEGRYLYPTYFEKRDSGVLQAVIAEALRGVAHQAGLEVD